MRSKADQCRERARYCAAVAASADPLMRDHFLDCARHWIHFANIFEAAGQVTEEVREFNRIDLAGPSLTRGPSRK
jgi:hypothetical protein